MMKYYVLLILPCKVLLYSVETRERVGPMRGGSCGRGRVQHGRNVGVLPRTMKSLSEMRK